MHVLPNSYILGVRVLATTYTVLICIAIDIIDHMTHYYLLYMHCCFTVAFRNISQF